MDSEQSQPKLKVLIADDEEAILRVISRTLKSKDYDVLAASNGIEALELFCESNFEISVAILDMFMPGINGFDLYREITHHKPGLPVIFTSGYMESDISVYLQNLDQVTFVHKPFNSAVLLNVVRESIHVEN